jgi:hypothetical protein
VFVGEMEHKDDLKSKKVFMCIETKLKSGFSCRGKSIFLLLKIINDVGGYVG